MSDPNPQAELHELVHDYVHDWCGGDEDDEANLHEEIRGPIYKRTDAYFEFMEWVNEKYGE